MKKTDRRSFTTQYYRLEKIPTLRGYQKRFVQKKDSFCHSQAVYARVQT